jgi:hypothetical protein
MSKSSTFLISDLISEQHTNLLNSQNNNKQKNLYHHSFTNSNSSNDFNLKMYSNSNYCNNKKSDELSNTRTTFSSHGGDTPSLSSTSSISSISNSRQDDHYSHINEYMFKNKAFCNFLTNANNYNVSLETNLIHSNNKYCNCMACNAVRFFSLVNPNFNENIISTNQQQEGLNKNINDTINNIHLRKIEVNQNKMNYLEGKN